MVKDGEKLLYVDESSSYDKDTIIAIVKKNGWMLSSSASAKFRGDKDVVLTAIKQNCESFRYASDELRGDKEVVLAAVKGNGFSFKYASDELRGDKEFVISAVIEDGYALRFASDELRSDKDVVLSAVRKDGCAIQFASEELKGDVGVVLEAVEQNGFSINFANNELRANKEVAMAVIRIRCDYYAYCVEKIQRDPDVIDLANQGLRRYQQCVDDHLCNELKKLKEKYGVDKLEVALEMEAADIEVGKLSSDIVNNCLKSNISKRL